MLNKTRGSFQHKKGTGYAICWKCPQLKGGWSLACYFETLQLVLTCATPTSHCGKLSQKPSNNKITNSSYLNRFWFLILNLHLLLVDILGLKIILDGQIKDLFSRFGENFGSFPDGFRLKWPVCRAAARFLAALEGWVNLAQKWTNSFYMESHWYYSTMSNYSLLSLNKLKCK